MLTKKNTIIIYISLTLITISAFSFAGDGDNSNPNEVVMPLGSAIVGTNLNGNIKIEATKDLERLYTFDHHTIRITMLPRDKRWDGSLGIYNPTGNGSIHTVVEEGQQHFCSEDEALEWLSCQNERLQYVWSSDGIAVGWYKTTSTLCVQVWQILIFGEKPKNLPGARNNSLNITFNKDKMPNQVRFTRFSSSMPQIIDGRWYSGKSIDIMKEKKISPTMIEKCIIHGNSNRFKGYIYSYTFVDNSVLWAILDQERVILVGN